MSRAPFHVFDFCVIEHVDDFRDERNVFLISEILSGIVTVHDAIDKVYLVDIAMGSVVTIGGDCIVLSDRLSLFISGLVPVNEITDKVYLFTRRLFGLAECAGDIGCIGPRGVHKDDWFAIYMEVGSLVEELLGEVLEVFSRRL